MVWQRLILVAVSGCRWVQVSAILPRGASIFIVTLPSTESSGTYRLLWFGKTGTTADQIAIDQTSSTGWRNYVYAGASSSNVTASGLSTTAYQALEAVYDGVSTSTLYQNGAQVAQSTSMQTANNILRTANNIGCYNNGASEFFKGNIAEIIVYNTALSSAQRQSVENYLIGESMPWAEASPTLAAPSVTTPQYALVNSPQTVTITPPPGAVAYYTINGGSSTLYTGPFAVTGTAPSTTTISVTAIAPGYQTSSRYCRDDNF